ncbi:hypothetical protein ACLOJK_010240 [Asimina triloba]
MSFCGLFYMETMLPMTAEAIKITEKKMSMTLDDIIKMSKKCSFKARKSRSSRRGQRSGNRGTSQGKSSKVQRFLDSRTAIRQRRLNPKGKGQPPMAEYAWSVAVAPVHDSVFTRNKDKYQRMPSESGGGGGSNQVLSMRDQANGSLSNDCYHECRPAYGPFQMKAIEAGVSRKLCGHPICRNITVEQLEPAYITLNIRLLPAPSREQASRPVIGGIPRSSHDGTESSQLLLLMVVDKQVDMYLQPLLRVKEASELRPGQTLDSLFANMKTQRMRTTCRRQMQQAQPLGVRAIEGQRRARGIRKAEGASFTNRTEQKCAGWLASFTV